MNRRIRLLMLVSIGCTLLFAPHGRRAAGEDASAKATRFAAAKLEEPRKKAGVLRERAGQAPEGWSISAVDPHDLVAAFAPLAVRRGVALRAYQFREGGNGNGVVWATPRDAKFPAPDRCPLGKFVPTLELEVPRPPAAFASVMAHIEGDGSPWSYLAASVLHREILDFGALWHGNKWSTHRIVDRDPLQSLGRGQADDDPMFAPRGTKRQWRWLKAKPDDWRPEVRIEADRVTVTFHTYSGWQQQRIFQHTDRYTVGSYDCASDCAELAVGPGGFMF